MTFFTFLIACLNAYIFSRLFDKFKPQIKRIGLECTYHIEAFCLVHFWTIDQIKQRDLKKRTPLKITEVEYKDVPRAFKWNVNLHNMERKEYETVEVQVYDNLLESKK